MDVNFELYKVFYHVAKCKSFSEAASRLYISQSAVSQSIKLLEEKLKCRLFIRNTKNIKLTKEGEKLFIPIEQAVNLIMVGERTIDDIHNLKEGEVRIGASDTICRHYLLPYIEKFNNLYPNIKIHITNRTSPVCTKLLQKGDVDLALINILDDYDYKGFDVKKLRKVNDVFIAGSKFIELSNRKVSLKELSHYPLLALEKNTNTRHFFDELFESNGLYTKPEIELSSVDLLIDIAKIGIGISYVPKLAALEEIRLGRLFIININETIPERYLGLIIVKNMPLPIAAKKFIDTLTH